MLVTVSSGADAKLQTGPKKLENLTHLVESHMYLIFWCFYLYVKSCNSWHFGTLTFPCTFALAAPKLSIHFSASIVPLKKNPETCILSVPLVALTCLNILVFYISPILPICFTSFCFLSCFFGTYFVAACHISCTTL